MDEVTGPSSAVNVDTPVGDRDRKTKIQLCIEFREKILKKKASQQLIEVTVMWVKHLPRNNAGKAPNPFVKLRLTPDQLIFSTELKNNKNEANYVEIFEFPVEKENMGGKQLHVQVCDRKVTRSATCFGEVVIPLGHLKDGQPVCKWYELVSPVLK